jgi:hypothetical protein
MLKRVVLCGVLMFLAGCAQGTGPGAPPVDMPSSPASSTPGTDAPLPTLTQPTAPPENPTDQIKKTGTVVGLVTRGGSGPCYGIQTDNGTQYALYSSAKHELPRGKYVRVQTKPSLLRIDCGPGKLLEIVRVESIN